MVAVVSVETVLLVVLIVLVAGLLRSHAEILRRLGPSGGGAADAQDVSEPSALGAGANAAPARVAGALAPAIAGLTPDRDSVLLDFSGGRARPTLLAFLSSGCSSCAGFWQTLAEPRLPPEVQTVIVTRGADRERPAGVRALAPSELAVVMSSQAWEDYQVPGSPYFVLVDGDVRGEGVATTWQALASLVSDAIEDHRLLAPADAAVASPAPRRASSVARGQRVDEAFAAAGIGTDHPSLRPGSRSAASASAGELASE
jgi:hypothetical protein